MGNSRVSYTEGANGNAQVVEENSYYAFGLQHKGYGAAPTGLGNAHAERYKYNGKELNEELGLSWYDYGARNYDAAIGRWMNVDPLAYKYSSLTPYAYAVNNPVYFIDPDGMKIINGDEVKRKEAAKNNAEWQQALQQKADYLGISVNASRKEWKKAALAKDGDAEWKMTQNVRKEASKAANELDNYTRASEKTEAKINELKNDAPSLFEKMDALSTDIYFQSVNNLGKNDGQNNTVFDVTDVKNVTLKSEFGLNSTVIKTANNPSPGRTTLEVSQHELGHADYIIENTQSYYEWLKKNNLLNTNHDGHANGDPSGARATQFGPKSFKKN